MTVAQLRELLAQIPQECDTFPVTFCLHDEQWAVSYAIVIPPLFPRSLTGRVRLQHMLFPGQFWAPPCQVYNQDGPVS